MLLGKSFLGMQTTRCTSKESLTFVMILIALLMFLDFALQSGNLKKLSKQGLREYNNKIVQVGLQEPSNSEGNATRILSLPSSDSKTSVQEDSVHANTTAGYCEGKVGILMIQGGDAEAAVGTLFFMYVANHLIYADRNNLVPWIHLNPVFPCYDSSVHGNATKSFTMLSGAAETRTFGTGNLTCEHSRRKRFYPGPITTDPALTPSNFTLHGNGLWQSYFSPLGEYPPDDPSCQDKPLIMLHKRSIYPGLHICAPWGIRPWALPHIPQGMSPEFLGQTYHEWLAPMRDRGAAVVSKYFRPERWIEELTEKANSGGPCLAMHIRLTDKGHRRRKKPLTLFQSYAEAYAEASGGGSIFIATDDGTILNTIRKNWTISAEDKLHYQKNVLRSSGTKAIFRAFQNETHRTNTEGIVDIYAMSKCDFLVHGFSAMAEAAVYINPALHNRSVNVDVDDREIVKVIAFRRMVEEYYAMTQSMY